MCWTQALWQVWMDASSTVSHLASLQSASSVQAWLASSQLTSSLLSRSKA